MRDHVKMAARQKLAVPLKSELKHMERPYPKREGNLD